MSNDAKHTALLSANYAYMLYVRQGRVYCMFINSKNLDFTNKITNRF